MSRLSFGAAAFGLAISSIAAITPAKADPFHLIRWSDTGFCQVWDSGIPTVPWPGNYAVVSRPIPTFLDALDVKSRMLQAGACRF